MRGSTTFEKLEPMSKKTRVLSQVKETILSGKIQSAEQIVEGKLAQQFGVGQGLIREVLIELEHQGFVQRTPFSGTRVTELSHADAEQIFDLRIRLEPLAFDLAGKRARAKDLRALWKLADKTRQSVESGDLDHFFEDHLAYRCKAWELSGNKYLQGTLERLVIPLFALYLIRGSYNRDGLLQTARDCAAHQESTLRAIENGDLTEARQVVEGFLKRMKGNLGSKLLPTS